MNASRGSRWAVPASYFSMPTTLAPVLFVASNVVVIGLAIASVVWLVRPKELVVMADGAAG